MMRTRLFAVGLCCLALAWATAGRSLGQEAGEGAPPAAGPGREEPAEEGGEGGERPVDLGKIVVTAEREKSGYAQDVILAEDVAQARRSADVDGLLKDLAGVQLSRQSSAGSDSNRVRLRGFDESRSLILFNGRSLHGAGVYGGYYVDWSSLSLEEVERVEIIRGAGPAKHGNTLGGVVNIVTREGTESPRTVVRSAGGNLGTWDAQASHSGGVDRLRYSLAASHYETDGYLRNASVDREALAARFALKLPAEMELTAGVRFTENECGMTVYNRPDSPYYDYRKPKSLESQLGGPYVPFLNHNWGPKDWGDGSYWKDEKWQFDWGLSRETEESGFLLQAYLFDESREEYFYAMDDPRHLALQRESKPEDRNWGWRADFHNLLEFAGQHKIEYGLEGHYLGYGDMDVRKVDATYFPFWGVPTSSPGERNLSQLNGGYVQDLWTVNDWLEVEPGLRFDSFEADGPEADAITVDEDEWSPRVALTVRPWEGGHVTGRYARAYRFPTLPEYYWWYSGYEPADRKDLTSEKADQWEVEIGHEVPGRFAVQVRGYHYEVDDYIRTIFGYMPSRVVYNIDRVDFQGLEIEASHELPHGLSVWANYTVQRTEKHGDILDNSSDLTDELVELPENRFGLGLDYRRENGLEARLALRFVDERHAVRGDLTVPGASTLERMDSYVDVDLHLSCPLLRGAGGQEARLLLAVENLLDDDHEEEYGYPMPGVTLTAGLSVGF